MDKAISLSELNKRVQSGIKSIMPDAYWIRAEIGDIKENYSGHCYLELIEKGKDSDKIVAKAKAIIWSYSYRMIKPYFRTAAGRDLSEGMNVMVQVTVEFHELYGFSLVIKDIDPAFTVGDIALKKTQIIKQLKDEGVFDMNRQFELPLVPQRIAVISSKTAAGFEDFITHLDSNAFGYHINWKLFPAVMQGEETERSVIAALDRINQVIHRFDAVAIIRGGGAQSDLSSFDSYWLAYHVTQFPLPVLSGIGHEQDESIVDMVAHTRLKTPTAVAGFLLDRFQDFEAMLNEKQDELIGCVQDIIDEENETLERYAAELPLMIRAQMDREKSILQQAASDIRFAVSSILHHHDGTILQNKTVLKQTVVRHLLRKENLLVLQKQNILHASRLLLRQNMHNLDLKESVVTLSDPGHILQKGYSITTHDGRVLKNAGELTEGQELTTRLHQGVVKSRVIK